MAVALIANSAGRKTSRRPTDASRELSQGVTDTLLQRVAAGEMAAMQETIDRYGGLVWSLARRFSPSSTDAEDAVQEVFIALWENAARFDPNVAGEVTFVAMIARRRLIDRGRKLQRQKKTLNEFQIQLPPADSAPATSESDAAQSDEVKRVRSAMKELSSDQQHVLTLSIQYGLTHEQIAEHTKMPLGTVKTHARRGLIKVREALSRNNVAAEAAESSS